MSIITNENRGQILGGGKAPDESPSVSSAQAAVEIAGPVSSLGVGGGCLEVSPEEYLHRRLDEFRAKVKERRADYSAAKLEKHPLAMWFDGQADAYEHAEIVLESLCERLGFPTERQPPDNDLDETRPRAKDGC